ncbi:MAG TPA: carbamoyltransferase HypF, partial [Verrucomicrobiae bacterium]|nr:carbamoyltransferase HypF [Verrucomicrobiae bacterium]
RIAAAYLIHLFGDESTQYLKYISSLSGEELAVLQHQVKRRLNTFDTSSCGRLFDAVSALLGVCGIVNYEGQAAIELEAAIDTNETGSYDFTIETLDFEHILQVKPLFRGILADLAEGLNPGAIAAKFHNTVVIMLYEMAKTLSLKLNTGHIALSGGVFQNKYLVEQLIPRLENAGFRVSQHLNPGDGSLCIGQAIVASEVIENVSGNTGQGNNCF